MRVSLPARGTLPTSRLEGSKSWQLSNIPQVQIHTLILLLALASIKMLPINEHIRVGAKRKVQFWVERASQFLYQYEDERSQSIGCIFEVHNLFTLLIFP